MKAWELSLSDIIFTDDKNRKRVKHKVEVKFEAHGVCSSKNEFYEAQKISNRYANRHLRPVLMFFSALCLIMFIYDIYAVEYVMAMISIGFSFLMFYPSTFSYLLEAQRKYENGKNKILYVEFTYLAYEEYMTVKFRDEEKKLRYGDILSVKMTKTKLYLITADKIYFADRNRFEKGTAQGLKDFIADKVKTK